MVARIDAPLKEVLKGRCKSLQRQNLADKEKRRDVFPVPTEHITMSDFRGSAGKTSVTQAA